MRVRTIATLCNCLRFSIRNAVESMTAIECNTVSGMVDLDCSAGGRGGRS